MIENIDRNVAFTTPEFEFEMDDDSVKVMYVDVGYHVSGYVEKHNHNCSVDSDLGPDEFEWDMDSMEINGVYAEMNEMVGYEPVKLTTGEMSRLRRIGWELASSHCEEGLWMQD